jgi:histidyl-tRNA synthetase
LSIIQAIRGMNDVLPSFTRVYEKVETVLKTTAAAYGYQEIRFPLLEKTSLFKRSIGEITDIVEKEMYTFEDRSGESITLRPEGTAGCVRAGIEQGLFYHQTHRLWYLGPMFRYERPQKGRYRQFYQFGMEAFGFQGPDIDAEIILYTARLFRELGLSNLVLHLNSLGSSEARDHYRTVLIDFFVRHQSDLDEDSLKRLHRNPLRILDSKNTAMQPLLKEAPCLIDYLDEDSKKHFEWLCQLLTQEGINYEINPRLVRGLDYYNKTVFEWITSELGSQGTVCGGGRYDGLVEQLGGSPTDAVGFSLGLERLVELVISNDANLLDTTQADIYFILGPEAVSYGLSVAEKLRTIFPKQRMVVHCGGGGIKAQFKRADKSGAAFAIVIGEDEIAQNKMTLKPLRTTLEQQRYSWEELVNFLNTKLEVVL